MTTWIQSSFCEAHLRYGSYLSRERNYELALQSFLSAMKLDPQDVRAQKGVAENGQHVMQELPQTYCGDHSFVTLVREAYEAVLRLRPSEILLIDNADKLHQQEVSTNQSI